MYSHQSLEGKYIFYVNVTDKWHRIKDGIELLTFRATRQVRHRRINDLCFNSQFCVIYTIIFRTTLIIFLSYMMKKLNIHVRGLSKERWIFYEICFSNKSSQDGANRSLGSRPSETLILKIYRALNQEHCDSGNYPHRCGFSTPRLMMFALYFPFFVLQ